VNRKTAKPSKLRSSLRVDPKIVEQTFDQRVNYETEQKQIRYQAPQLILRHLSRHVPGKPLLLDIGCGTGLFGLLAKKKIKGCSITAPTFPVACWIRLEKKASTRN
jgi:predicted TPR repeat methyltransferase